MKKRLVVVVAVGCKEDMLWKMIMMIMMVMMIIMLSSH